jgi:hypothetical protein
MRFEFGGHREKSAKGDLCYAPSGWPGQAFVEWRSALDAYTLGSSDVNVINVIPPGASLEDEYGNLDKHELVSQKIALNRRCICRC